MVHPEEASHSHNTPSCNAISERRRDYIETHLEDVRKECQGYEACVNSIMRSNSALTIIEGRDLELRTVCRSLLPEDWEDSPLYRGRWRGRGGRNASEVRVRGMGGEEEDASCPLQARRTIRRDISGHVEESLEERDHHPEWQQVWQCLEGDPEPKQPPFLQVCRMAFSNRTVCNSTIHRTLRSFFTQQLEHLQCVCQALPDPASRPLGLIVGASAGGAALLLLLVVLLLLYCCYCRPKRRKRRAMKRNDASWDSWGPPIYIAGASERQDSVYSEIDEGSGGQGRVLLGPKARSSRPPTLPSRYTRGPAMRQPPVGADGYLEPGASSPPCLQQPALSRSGSVEAEYLLAQSLTPDPRKHSGDSEYLRLLPSSPLPSDVSKRGDGGEGDMGGYFVLEPDSGAGLPPSRGPQQEEQETHSHQQQQQEQGKQQQDQQPQQQQQQQGKQQEQLQQNQQQQQQQQQQQEQQQGKQHEQQQGKQQDQQPQQQQQQGKQQEQLQQNQQQQQEQQQGKQQEHGEQQQGKQQDQQQQQQERQQGKQQEQQEQREQQQGKQQEQQEQREQQQGKEQQGKQQQGK